LDGIEREGSEEEKKETWKKICKSKQKRNVDIKTDRNEGRKNKQNEIKITIFCDINTSLKRKCLSTQLLSSHHSSL
jgi:hypothetical protein